MNGTNWIYLLSLIKLRLNGKAKMGNGIR